MNRNVHQHINRNHSSVESFSAAAREAARKVLSTLFILFAGAFQIAYAQSQKTSPERGFNPGNSYAISDIESISQQSGNLMLNMPLGSLPAGRGGMSAGVSLHYNSKLWDKVPNEICGPADFTFKDSEDGGWRYGYLYRLDHEGYYNPKTQIVLPDGSKHLLWLEGVTQENGETPYYPDGRGMFSNYPDIAGTMTYFTLDGTFLKLQVEKDSDTNWGNNRWTLFMPDGSRVVYNPNLTANPPSGLIQRVIDRNGNYIDYTEAYDTASLPNHLTTTISDQLGRSVQIEYDAASNTSEGWTQDYVRSKGFGGADLTTKVQWKKAHVRRTYVGCIGNENSPTYNMYRTLNSDLKSVDRIYLPAQFGDPQNANDLYYEFAYNADAPASPSTTESTGWGEVSKVTLPSGAYSEYKYKHSAATQSITASRVINNRPIEKKLSYKLEYDGTSSWTSDTWQYDAVSDYWGDVVSSSSITAPDGSISYEYYGGWNGAANPVDNKYSDGFRKAYKSVSGNGTISEKIYANNVPTDASLIAAANQFVEYELTTITDISGTPVKTAIRQYKQDKNGNTTEVREYDFVAYSSITRDANGRVTNLPSNLSSYLKRITKTEYYNDAPDASSTVNTDADGYHAAGSSPLRSLVKSTEIQNAANVPQSRSEIYYDFINYNSSNTKGGNSVETRSWDSTKQATLQSADSNGYKLLASNYVNALVAYDAYGNPTLTADAKGNQSQITYGAINGYTGLYPTQTISAYGTSIARTSTINYDFYSGLSTSATDVDNNLTAATTYDDLGRPTKAAAGVGTALEIWTQTVYDDLNRKVIVKSDVETKGDARKVATQFYDQLGRVRLSKTLENAATQSAINETDGIKVQTRYKTTSGFTYQLTSNPYRADYPANAGGEATMGWTQSKAINTGKHSEVETFSGAALPTAFGGNNTNSTGVVTTDVDADRTLVTDQAGKRRISRTNALGQLENVWEITAADSDTEAITFGSLSLNGYKTGYVYDTLNNLTTVAQGGQQPRSFAYTSLSRLKTANNPESGVIQYQYDNNGNLTKKIDARLVETSYSYDALNRVTTRSYANEPAGQNPTPAVTHYYDGVYFNAANQQQTAIGAVKGKLTSVSSIVSRTNYSEFDSLGRVLKSQQITDGAAYPEMTYTYNLSGALVEQKYPSGRVVKNVLDNDGDLSIVQSKKNQTAGFWNYADNFTYNASGAVTSMQLGNGRWESTAFNSRLQPVQIALGTVQNGTDKLKLNFTYNTVTNGNPNADNNGNVLSQTIVVPTEVRNSTTYNGFTATQSYSYDSLNRIKQATETVSGQTGNNWQQTFDYDRFGNRTFNEANTTASANFPKDCSGAMCAPDKKIYNPQAQTSNNRFSTTDGYQYDSAGNTTRDAQSRKFTYDGENKQTKVETVDSNGTVTGTLGEYFYDGDGKRVKKYSFENNQWITTIFVYDAQGKLVAEYANQISQTPTVSYLTSDHLGSPRINADANGTVTARHDYQPFGQEIQRASYDADSIRKQFTGYERDKETELDFAQARYFDPGFGRFSSPDVFWKDSHVANPQSWNKYVYVRNNPLSLIDATGEKATVTVTVNERDKTVTVMITANIGIWSADKATKKQLNTMAKNIEKQIESRWSGTFDKDGYSYNVSTDVNVQGYGGDGNSNANSNDDVLNADNTMQNVIEIKPDSQMGSSGVSNPHTDPSNKVNGTNPDGTKPDLAIWRANAALVETEPGHEFGHLLGINQHGDGTNHVMSVNSTATIFTMDDYSRLNTINQRIQAISPLALRKYGTFINSKNPPKDWFQQSSTITVRFP